MSATRLRENQFQHSNQWKIVLHQFTQQLPIKSNTRSFKNFPDSFTGRDALACIHKIIPNIFEPNKCTIDAAKGLLNLYLNVNKFIVNVKDQQSARFEDNTTLYRLNWSKINAELEDFDQKNDSTFSVRRTGSLRGSEENFNPRPKQVPKRQPASFSRASTNLESLELNQIDGRLSISYNDLTSETKDSPPQKKLSSVRNNLSGMIVGSISRASASIFSLNRSASASCESRKTTPTVRNRSNPKFLDDAVLKENKLTITKEATTSKILTSSRSVFRVRTSSVINCTGGNTNKNVASESRGEENITLDKTEKKRITNSTTTTITAKANSRFRPSSVNSQSSNEIYDEYKFWHSSLLNRLMQQIPVGIKFGGFIPVYFSGADLRWNCQHINPKNGIVDQFKETSEVLSRDLVSSLRIFCSFNEKISKNCISPTNKPNEVKNLAMPLIISKNAPFLFESLKEQLSKIAPIIPIKISICLKNIWNLYTSGKSFISDWNTVDNRLLIAFRLCLLTLQPNKLRNLQILCKYIQRISLDRQLLAIIFKEEKSNLENSLLQSFSIYFIQTNENNNITENTTIFSILINKIFDCLFSSNLPKLLEEDVQKMIKSNKIGSSLSPSDFAPSITFCDRINKSTYEQQSKLVEPHLTTLLEAIISDKNLSCTEKEEKLKSFRISYPSVYLQKFPSSSSEHLFIQQLPIDDTGNTLMKNFMKMFF